MSAEAKLIAWVEQTIGGHVVRIDRLARWRPAWDIDLDIGGKILPLHARGERELNFAIPYRIADEAPTHDLLEKAGLPVPHAYGLCDDPYVLVMDRLPGKVDLSFAASDAERTALIDAYLQLLPKIYGIPLAEAARIGFSIPANPREIALGSFIKSEAAHDALMPQADPVAAFLRKWLHRNFPQNRTVPRFITYDAFQFMFEDGKITGLLDFELAHVGDPLMDLAALRVRDTIKSLGDLAVIAERFSEITGEALDFDAIDYHSVVYNTLTVLSAAPPLAAPVQSTDYVSHMAWYVNSARWAFEILGDILGIVLPPADPVAPRKSRRAPAFDNLADGMRAIRDDRGRDYESAALHRLVRYLARADSLGPAVDEDHRRDIESLLGKFVSTQDADDLLLDFIETAGSEHDAALVRLLNRRVQRNHMLMAPDTSLLRRHPPLRSVRPGSVDTTRAEDRWPAGAIPGTG